MEEQRCAGEGVGEGLIMRLVFLRSIAWMPLGWKYVWDPATRHRHALRLTGSVLCPCMCNTYCVCVCVCVCVCRTRVCVCACMRACVSECLLCNRCQGVLFRPVCMYVCICMTCTTCLSHTVYMTVSAWELPQHTHTHTHTRMYACSRALQVMDKGRWLLGLCVVPLSFTWEKPNPSHISVLAAVPRCVYVYVRVLALDLR